MRKGFALLEVMIASLIAALLSTGLLTTIAQVNRLQETLNTITSVYGRVAIVQNLLERDLMGAFVPTQVELIQTTTEHKTEKASPVDKVFYGKMMGGRLDLFTFITNNPLQIYFGIKDSKLKPRVARVVYRLLPDERRANSFVLMRQEGRTLALGSYKKDSPGSARAYAVIDGIQSLSVHYITIEQKKSDEAEGKGKFIYKKQNSWDSQKKPNDLKQRREPVRLPNFVELQMVLWDSSYQSPRSFKLVIPIMAMSGEYRQEQNQQETKKIETPRHSPVGALAGTKK